LALFALSLPVVALSVDMNGVVVLLPTIGRDLGVTPAVAGAIVSVASLAFAAPLLLEVGKVPVAGSADARLLAEESARLMQEAGLK